jgi:hypothetical protein
VGLPSVVLTPFASAHDPLGVRHRGQLVEALSERISDKGPGSARVSTDPTMDILQQLFSLVVTPGFGKEPNASYMCARIKFTHIR